MHCQHTCAGGNVDTHAHTRAQAFGDRCLGDAKRLALASQRKGAVGPVKLGHIGGLARLNNAALQVMPPAEIHHQRDDVVLRGVQQDNVAPHAVSDQRDHAQAMLDAQPLNHGLHIVDLVLVSACAKKVSEGRALGGFRDQSWCARASHWALPPEGTACLSQGTRTGSSVQRSRTVFKETLAATLPRKIKGKAGYLRRKRMPDGTENGHCAVTHQTVYEQSAHCGCICGKRGGRRCSRGSTGSGTGSV